MSKSNPIRARCLRRPSTCAAFGEAMRQLSHLSQIDTVLNTLDDLKKSIDTALAAAEEGE